MESGFKLSEFSGTKPLEELTNDKNPPKYSNINWAKFRTARMQSNFTKPMLITSKFVISSFPSNQVRVYVLVQKQVRVYVHKT